MQFMGKVNHTFLTNQALHIDCRDEKIIFKQLSFCFVLFLCFVLCFVFIVGAVVSPFNCTYSLYLWSLCLDSLHPHTHQIIPWLTHHLGLSSTDYVQSFPHVFYFIYFTYFVFCQSFILRAFFPKHLEQCPTNNWQSIHIC